MRRLRVLVFAAVGGALTGCISYAFLEALDRATRTRVELRWPVFLLPVAGFVVAGVYHRFGGRAKGGTPAVIEQANTFTHGVPARMAPLIFGGAIAGHVVGAAVGREGAALQMAGSVTDTAARAARLTHDERRTLIAASLAGGWGAVFGVPVTGVVFTLQVTERHRWRAFLPAIVAATTGRLVVDAFGYRFGARPRIDAPAWTIGLPLKLVVAGVVMGLLGRLFVAVLKGIRHHTARHVHWPPLRAALGGVATLGLMAVVGREYLGLSMPLLERGFDGAHVDLWVPILKLTFTAIALGTGFVGGEVAPLFVMGSTMGAALAPGLHAPAPLLATTGSAAAFASAASVMLTGIVLTVEQFGPHALVPAVIVGVSARIAAGRPGLYVAH